MEAHWASLQTILQKAKKRGRKPGV
jgi:hypothetical protein